MQPFIHLHVHTQFSVLDGQASVKGLVDKAIKDEMPAVAITDHGNMFGVKEFVDYIGKKNKDRKKEGLEPFKPIIGCEVYVARNGKENKRKEVKSDQRGWHLILLAKNKNGYKNLIKIVSRAWVDGFYYTSRTDHADLEKYHEDIICCSACLGGEVPSYVLKEEYDKAEASILWFKNLFGDDYYLELQRHKPTVPNAAQDTYPKQEKVNAFLVEMARKHNIKLIASNDVHFIDEEDAEAHHRLICVNTRQEVNDATKMAYTKQEWFKTQEEMNETFADLPEALSNTREIADKVEIYSIDHDPILPNFNIPEEFGTEESYRQKFSEQDLFDEFTRDENGNVVLSEEKALEKIKKLGGYDKLYRVKLEADYLAKLAWEGVERMYGKKETLSDEVKERINFELYIMKTMGFPGYFLIVQDFIRAAREELGVSVGPGRGSAAGSAVAYCLGITKVDPIKYDLLFERFLNPDRISLPDIDIDFDDDGRAEVLRWVENKYGKEKVAHIITYGTMATKSAIKDVARVEGLPIAESNRLAKLIPDRLNEPGTDKSLKINFKNCLQYVPELKAELESPNPLVRETMKYAVQLEGNVRNTGVHACGVIIGRDDISDWVPVSIAEDKETGEQLLVTQYEGSVIESTGLIKMDFLGLKTLSVINEALKNIKLSRGIDINIDEISLEDELTYQLYCKGLTTGTFQFESPGMQKYLRELQPSQFEDLIAMNALYRPGPMDYIPDFIDRKQGRKPIEYDIPIMEKYLKDTYGITVYQEQVMLLSRLLANFTRGESDSLRKAMGKKLKDKLDEMKPKFVSGGQANGHDPKVLEKIWADWEKFASYAFNKSHATCYSLVAYQTAYLKAHYPAEFMAAVMTRNINDIKEVTKMMTECKVLGIEVLGPDINESGYHFMVNKDGNIRFGLGAIKGMGESAVKAIIDERDKNGPYKSVYDLVERINLSACGSKNIETMAYAGAFDSFPDMVREQINMCNDKGEVFLETLMRYGVKFQEDKNNMFASIFGDELQSAIQRPPMPPMPLDWSKLERLNKEKFYVGMYLSAHPLDEYYVFMNYVCNLKLDELSRGEMQDDKSYVLGCMVREVKEMTSQKGDLWAIVTFEDYESTYDIRFFSREYAQWGGFLKKGNFLSLRGRYLPRSRWKPDEKTFVVQQINLLSQDAAEAVEKLQISVPLYDIDELFVDEFVNQMTAHPGKVSLYMQVYDDRSQPRLMTRLYSIKYKVNLTKELMEYLESIPSVKIKVN
ncbi:MAG: DNA polymerase III subunit alpha [Bacteroidales bacterium]|nr:DNA polymerase III subunit alpha [Bacteroidales bacterium]